MGKLVKTVFEPGVCVPGLDNYESITRDVLNNFEKKNVGEYLFEPGVCVPGLDNFKSLMRDTLKKLEK